MKRILFIFLLSVVTLLANAQCTFERFYKYYSDNQWATKTIKVKDGGFVTVTGMCYDSLNPGFSNGQDIDMCIVKDDSCGNTLWKTHYGYPSEGDDAIDAVETDSGDYLVMGTASFQQAFHNIRVAKFSKNGELIWSKLYSGSTESYASGTIIKRKNKNTYVVYGGKQFYYNPAPPVGKGYVFEIDNYGTILKNVDLLYNTAIRKTFEINDTTYLMLISGLDSLFLAETDTSFKVRWIKQLFTDTIVKVTKFYDACLSYDRQSIAISFDGTYRPPANDDHLVARISLTGEPIIYKPLREPFSFVTCIIPTPNNGYIMGTGMLYTDSNFNYIKYQYYRGGFASLVLNDDGSVTASGVGGDSSAVAAELYIIKVDSAGNTTYSSVNELPKELNYLTIYPNPANDQLHIITNTSHRFQIEMMNATGQTIYSSVFISEATINTQLFSEGIYFLRVTDVNLGIATMQKVVVMK